MIYQGSKRPNIYSKLTEEVIYQGSKRPNIYSKLTEEVIYQGSKRPNIYSKLTEEVIYQGSKYIFNPRSQWLLVTIFFKTKWHFRVPDQILGAILW
jgi:hypothetical protein